MRSRLSTVAMRIAIVAFVGGSVSLIPLTSSLASTSSTHARPAAGKKYLTAFATEPTSGWVSQNFNPLIPSGSDDFTRGAIYEPLMVITQADGGKTYPWLATKYKWAKNNKSLTVSLRHGVKWSDGKPFTSKDVVFTFNYGKKYKVDLTGLMTSGQITQVKASGRFKVVFHFKTVDTTLLQSLLANVCIIPQHIWKKVKNPLTFTNSKPVGTGPFTHVMDFSTQEYTLGRNPHYWQPLHYAGIRVPAFSSNTSALAAMVRHQVDWAPVFVQDAKKSWVDVDPKHFHYYYSPPTPPLDMMFNDQKYPFNQPALRQAISMSIKRKELSVKAENGNEKPSDAIGLKFLYPGWVNHKVDKLDKKLSTYDPKSARKTLKKDHFSWNSSGQLLDKSKNPVVLNITCPSGWSDWQTQLQILQQNLQAGLGMKVNISFIDQTAWFNDRSTRTLGGKGGALFGTESSGQTPYQYFWSFMSKESYFPVNGQLPGGSWNIEGWYSKKATSMLRQFRQTTNRKLQHSIVDRLQKVDLTNLPVITTVSQAQWYTWSTSNFKGFPTAKHYYAYGPGYTYPDNVKILTSLKPVK